jgi:digeranylgeranylglycerophospholipid reductase
MNKHPKILIIGAGPAGSHTAYNLAKNGINTTVYEEHEGIGVPTHCAGHLSIRSLNQLGLLPLPKEIVGNTFRGAIFHSPKGTEFSLHFPNPITCTVNRELFDKHLAQKAMNAEAKYSLSSRVESLLIENSTIKGVTVTHSSSKTTTETADIVIDAEGVTSRLLRQTNLEPPDPLMIISGVEAQIDNTHDTEPHTVEVFLGRQYAPGFYAWLIPLRNGGAKIGLGAKGGNPQQLLSKLMTKHPSASKKLANARIIKTAYHPIMLGGSLRRTCANGFLAVGDAASQVKPTTGGGVILGLNCAQIAAKTVQNAVQNQDFSYAQLSEYERLCGDRMGFDVGVMLQIRKLLNSLSDERIDEIMRLSSKLRLDESLQRVSEIDFQGKTLLAVMRDPRSWPMLLYFLFTCVAANP